MPSELMQTLWPALPPASSSLWRTSTLMTVLSTSSFTPVVGVHLTSDSHHDPAITHSCPVMCNVTKWFISTLSSFFFFYSFFVSRFVCISDSLGKKIIVINVSQASRNKTLCGCALSGQVRPPPPPCYRLSLTAVLTYTVCGPVVSQRQH